MREILFSSGAARVGNNPEFVGVGALENNEIEVQQIVSVEATYTTMRCFIEGGAGEKLNFTLRDNRKDTELTCTIESGNTTGSDGGTGTATLKPGDLVDIATPEKAKSAPEVAMSFAISG